MFLKINKVIYKNHYYAKKFVCQTDWNELINKTEVGLVSINFFKKNNVLKFKFINLIVEFLFDSFSRVE